MIDKLKPNYVSFSRILSLADTVALAGGFLLAQLVVMGRPITKVLGAEAPLSIIICGILYLPAILSLLERASETHGSANLYELSRLSYNKPLTFYSGWLILGGYTCLCTLFAWAVGMRIGVGLEKMLGITVNLKLLSAVVLVLTAATKAMGFQGKWRTRTWLITAAFAIILFVLVWSFVDHPPYRTLTQSAKPLSHWLVRVTIVGATLWYLDITLHYREQFQFAQRTMANSMVSVWALMVLLTAVLMFQLLRYPDLLMENWTARLTFKNNRLEMLLLFTGILVCQLALSKVLSRAIRVIAAMSLDGFLPRRFCDHEGQLRSPLIPLGLICANTLTAIFLTSFGLMVDLTVMTALWTVALVLYSHVVRRAQNLSAERSPKLPLHPLFPVFGAASCLLFSLIVPNRAIFAAILWLLSGACLYFLFAKNRSRIHRHEAIDVEALDKMEFVPLLTTERPRAFGRNPHAGTASPRVSVTMGANRGAVGSGVAAA